jgi:hypothetical protein
MFWCCEPMTLHFAYGSNMSCRLMRMRCPEARAIGTASLRDWRFIISPDGYASLERQTGARVHGVLWRLSARDVAAINAYENVQSGLYVRRTLPVRFERSAPALEHDPEKWIPLFGKRSSFDKGVERDDDSMKHQPALVYIARSKGSARSKGFVRPRPGYLAQVVEAARYWRFPQRYICSLARWAPSGWGGARATEVGEVA